MTRPTEGRLAYIDGFPYLVGPAREVLIDAAERAGLTPAPGVELPAPMASGNTAVQARRLVRGKLAHPELEMWAKANFNWKARTTCYDCELVEVSAEEYLAAARQQADQLVSGGATVGMRLWGQGSLGHLERVIPRDQGRFFMLPGRAMFKLPCRLNERNEPVVQVPGSLAEAQALAAGLWPVDALPASLAQEG